MAQIEEEASTITFLMLTTEASVVLAPGTKKSD
jgi:hypothetical protein